jgi:hypothetical protein
MGLTSSVLTAGVVRGRTATLPQLSDADGLLDLLLDLLLFPVLRRPEPTTATGR